jgi:hypothetical protein
MNCPDFHDSLQRFLDGDAASIETSAAREHLQSCGRCRRDLAAAQTLQLGLRQLPRPEVPVTLPRQLIEVVDRDLRNRRRMGWWRNAWILATAASLLAFACWQLLHPTPQTPVDAPKPEMAKNNAPKSDPAPRIEEAQKAFGDLAQNVQQTTKPLGVLIAGVNPIPQTPNVPIDVDATVDPAMQAAESLRSAGRNMAETFEPVANSARQAALFFAREIPVDFSSREN